MGLSCRLRGTSAAVGRGRRTRRNGREIRKFAREVAYVHLARYLPCTSGGTRYLWRQLICPSCVEFRSLEGGPSLRDGLNPEIPKVGAIDAGACERV